MDATVHAVEGVSVAAAEVDDTPFTMSTDTVTGAEQVSLCAELSERVSVAVPEVDAAAFTVTQ